MALLQPRWYFDADTIGLGKLLAPARRDVTWPGDTGERGRDRLRQKPSPITTTDTPDEVWIPRVTAAGMVIVTRDNAPNDQAAAHLARHGSTPVSVTPLYRLTRS